jgi:hypothetical protein
MGTHLSDPSEAAAVKRAIGKPIFICGHPKSGTTLLTALLDGHPQILVFPEETYYLKKVCQQPKFSVSSGTEYLLTESQCNKLSLTCGDGLMGNYDYSDFDYNTFKERFLNNLNDGRQTHGDVLESLVSAYAYETHQSGKKYWVEKSPGNERYLHLPLSWFSDMRAIYLVRDPRDVYTSHAKKRRMESTHLPIEKFVYRWGLSLWMWQQYIAKHAEHALTVRYEDLLRYPKETLSLICRFLDIDYEPILERPTKNKKPWLGNSMHGDKFINISTKPIGRWRTDLSKEQVSFIEAFLGKSMPWVGYQPATDPCTVRKIIRYWVTQKRDRKKVLAMLLCLYWPFSLPKPLIKRFFVDKL